MRIARWTAAERESNPVCLTYASNTGFEEPASPC